MKSNLLAQLDLSHIENQALQGFKFGYANTITGNVGYVIQQSLPYIFTSAGVILLFVVISGGLQLMTSKGEPGAIQQGQQKIQYGLIGFAIIFTAFWTVQIVGLLFGINVINTIFI